ncbi:MAG: PspC domain-containing protein [candidate division Zixibacteria bacterium]|nr:PspC domain-containing protein [candidate division Zixibacteria bacterium]
MPKRLYRSNSCRMLGGICGGMGEYFEVDPTVVRVIAVILGLASAGWAVIAYIIGWIIIPEELPGTVKAKKSSEPDNKPKAHYASATWTRYFPGLALIFFGSIILVRENLFWFAWDEIWPVMLIGIGLALIFWRSNSVRSADSAESKVETSSNNAHNERNESNESTVS